MKRLRVIGVGTPHGDDQVGLTVAAALRERTLPLETEVVSCDRPESVLVEAISGAEGVVIVDAMITGSAVGTVRRLAPRDIRRDPALSTHRFGVGEGLDLAEALGRLPGSVAIVGIEGADSEGDLPAAVTNEAVHRAAALVVEILEEMRAGTGPMREEDHDA